MKRLIVYFIEILFLYLIQSSTYHYFALANIMPNLLLILVVAYAYMRGRMTGLLLGFFSGLLIDLMYCSNVITSIPIIGTHALLYLLIGYFFGFLNKFYSNDDYTLPIIIIAVSEFIYKFSYYIIEFLLRGKLDFLYYLRRFIFPEMIYTVAVSIFLYKLLHMINKKLEHKQEEEV